MKSIPTPLFIAPSSNPKNGTHWRDLRAATQFGDMYVGEALEPHAQDIVRAVNAYDSMLEALKAAHERLTDNDMIGLGSYQLVKQIESAIAKAEGKA